MVSGGSCSHHLAATRSQAGRRGQEKHWDAQAAALEQAGPSTGSHGEASVKSPQPGSSVACS